MTASKRRGTAAETSVVAWLRSQGYRAHRRALAGAKDQGDVLIEGHDIAIEVKSCARLDLPGWLRELDVEMANAGSTDGVVIAKRRGSTDVSNWYAILPAAAWLALWERAR
jgi:hypothetical protein